LPDFKSWSPESPFLYQVEFEACGEVIRSYFHPDATGIYSWWSYMFHAREKNAGWRIDYFITSDRLQPKLRDAKIHTDIFGSDHCPIGLDIDL
jgi:exonuclease III